MAVGLEAPRRLVIRPQPYSDEHLISWWTRAAVANVLPRTSQILECVGADVRKISCRPDLSDAEIASLSVVLGARPDEFRRLLHEDVVERPGHLDWWGTPLSKDLIDFAARRVAVTSVKHKGYVPAEWMIRPITFCRDTGERLISSCPICKKKLGWTQAVDPWCCDKCGREMTGRDRDAPVSHQAGEPLALLSPDARVRAKILLRLPEPFKHWEAGEAFEAIIELGMALINIDNGPLFHWRIPSLLNEWGEAALAAGYKFVMDWPRSFSSALRRIATDTRTPYSNRGVYGPFAKLVSYRRQDRLKALLKEVGDGIVRELGFPYGQRRASDCTYYVRDDRFVAFRDAVARYGIGIGCLKRLVPSGRSFVSRRDTKRTIKLFDAESLGRSARIYKEAARVRDASKVLGLPAFVVTALVEAGLLQRVEDHDANAMAAPQVLIDRGSVDALAEKFAPLLDMAVDASALDVLGARRFEPAAWIMLLTAAITEPGVLTGRVHRANVPTTEQLRFAASAERVLADVGTSRAPDNIYVSQQGAADLLDTYEVTIITAIEHNLLRATKSKRDVQISLFDLQRFHSVYATNAEAGLRQKRAGAGPVAGTRRGRIWRRSDLGFESDSLESRTI